MGEKIKRALGIADVSSQFLKLVEVNVCYMIFTNLHTLFVNTLFIKLTGDTNVVMKYNMLVYVLIPIFMVLCVWLMRKYSGKLTFVIGLADFLVLYGVFFSVMNQLDKFVVLIAILASAGQAFFMMSMLSATSLFSKNENINQTLAFSGFATGIVHLAMPYLSGSIIKANTGLTGYYIVFGLSVVVALYAFYKACKLPPIEFGGKTQYKKMLRIAFCDKTWQAFAASEVLKGYRGGVFNFYLSIMIFQLIQSEYLVGVNNILVGLFAIGGNWFIARKMRDRNRMHMVFFAITTLLVANLCLYFQLSVATIMIFAAVNSFFSCILGTGFSSMFYLAVKNTPGGEGLDGEFINYSQVLLGIGNMLGTLTVFVLSKNGANGAITAMVFLTATQYLCAFLVKCMQDRLQPGVEQFHFFSKNSANH